MTDLERAIENLRSVLNPGPKLSHGFQWGDHLSEPERTDPTWDLKDRLWALGKRVLQDRDSSKPSGLRDELDECRGLVDEQLAGDPEQRGYVKLLNACERVVELSHPL